jgi:hypothetical protein
MLRRILTVLALLSLALPSAAFAQDREWEEDYTDRWRDDDQQAPDGDYDVSVDLNDQGSVSIESFQGALSPYGEWVQAGGYGRAWRPRVAAGWRPYYYGRWEWTNEGWLWVSDEPWGWAAYHYGRWTYDPGYGWLWIPGYQWAPAWVAWRYSGDVVGWAPLGPGVSVYVNTYPFVDYWWTFVPTVRFVAVPVYTVAYAPTHTRQYFYSTAPAPARPVPARPVPGGRPAPSPAWGGPAPRAIEQRIGRPVTPVRVVPAPSPGAARPVGPGEVAIYRPERSAPRPSDGARGRGPGAVPGRGEAAPGPGRGNSFGPSPGREAPGGYVPPGRAAPGRDPARGPGAAPAPGGDREQPGAAPPGRDPGRGGRPAPRRSEEGAWAPRGGGRASPGSGGGFGPPARGERAAPAREAPARAESRRAEASSGGYAPAPRSAPQGGGGGGYAPAPSRPPQGGGGGGGDAPAPSRGGDSGGGRPAPAPARERERR